MAQYSFKELQTPKNLCSKDEFAK